jgi:hypothetical protein
MCTWREAESSKMMKHGVETYHVVDGHVEQAERAFEEGDGSVIDGDWGGRGSRQRPGREMAVVS